MGPLASGETTLAREVLQAGVVGAGMVLLADREFVGAELWRQAHATGAELVWRSRQDVKLEVLEVFEDGSWRSELGTSHPKGKRVAVRVIDYRLDDPSRPGDQEGYRLITTILDPERAPGGRVAGAVSAAVGAGDRAG